jgi:hypothetical protein
VEAISGGQGVSKLPPPPGDEAGRFTGLFLFGVSAYAKNINDRRLALMSYAFTAGSTALVASMRWSLQFF